MSKLKCMCGHIIGDQTDNLRYKGYILPDTALDNVSTSLTNSIDSLADSIKLNNQLEWVKRNFIVPPYPTDLNHSSIIHDLLSTKLIDTKQDIFECENCGRIAIEVGQTNQFRFFTPETDDTKGILKGKE